MNTLLVWIAMVGVLVSAQSGAGKAELDATVHVRVVALGTGEPLEGVWVWAGRKPFDGTPSEFMFGLSGGESNASRAYQSMGGVGALVQTPASGEVDLRVTSGPGLWIAAMGSSGDQARLDPLASGARTELDFELRSGRTRYQGLVRERVSGAPVGGARIEGLDFDAHMLAETKTDAAGRFCLDGESLAEVRITARGFGMAFGTVTDGHARPEQALVFRLDRAARLRGVVLEPDGRPLAGTRVRCTVDPYHLQQPGPKPEGFWERSPENLVSWQAATDAEGRFELELPPRAWLRLELLASRSPWSELYALGPGEERELVIVPHARVTLSGKALDREGQPAAGLRLRARRLAFDEGMPQAAFCGTGTDGEFRFDALMPGTWFVGPVSDPEDLGFASREQRVELASEPRAQELTLHLERGLFLRGWPSDVSGEHESYALVEARTSDGRLVGEVRSDSDGRFSLGPLAAGEYVLRASRHGQFVAAGVAAHAGACDVAVPLPTLAGRIVTRVTNIRWASAASHFFPRSRPDLARTGYYGDGCVQVPANLEAGLYDVVVTTDDLRLGRLEGVALTAEEMHVGLVLEPCASLRLVFTGPELFARVIARQGEAVYASAIATQGAACSLLVPPGKVRLEAFPLNAWDDVPRGVPLVREIMVALGEEPEVLVP